MRFRFRKIELDFHVNSHFVECPDLHRSYSWLHFSSSELLCTAVARVRFPWWLCPRLFHRARTENLFRCFAGTSREKIPQIDFREASEHFPRLSLRNKYRRHSKLVQRLIQCT